MKRKIISTFLILISFCVSLFAEDYKTSSLPIKLDLSNIASFASYKIEYSTDPTFSSGLVTNLKLEKQKRVIENQVIEGGGTIYLKWDVESTYPCLIQFYSAGPLYGKDGGYGEEYIPLHVSFKENESIPLINASITKNGEWGSVAEFKKDEASSRVPYETKAVIAELDLGNNATSSTGSVQLDFKTGNAFGRAPQTYTCNIVFEIVSKV